MKLQFVLTQVTPEQLDTLSPLTEHSDIKKYIDEYNEINKELTDSLYVGYFFLNDVFHIIATPEAKDDKDALHKALQYIYHEEDVQKEIKHEKHDIEKTQHTIITKHMEE